MKQRFRLTLLFGSLCLALASHSQRAFPAKPKAAPTFPIGPELAKAVWFWEKVFAVYSSQVHVIHDSWFPELIIDTLDLSPVEAKWSRRQKTVAVESYLERYRLAIRRFHEEGAKAVHHGAMERRLFQVYKQHPAALAHLLRGEARIRSQQGLADIFQEAALRAQQYLPYMEAIFREQGLPIELTRMVFVESMFRLDARSKVGASGIWQFMPHTARKFITVTPLLDERNSPLKATKAAALLLREHHKKLGHWPLAITSYNHGVNGILRAVKAVGSHDLESIIRRYDSPSFGFASRNFYGEFVAAKNTYERQFAAQRPKNKNPLGITAITLPGQIAIAQLLRFTPLTETMLKKLNPCILPQAYSKTFRYTPLPPRYSLIVPAPLAKKVKTSLARIRS